MYLQGYTYTHARFWLWCEKKSILVEDATRCYSGNEWMNFRIARTIRTPRHLPILIMSGNASTWCRLNATCSSNSSSGSSRSWCILFLPVCPWERRLQFARFLFCFNFSPYTSQTKLCVCVCVCFKRAMAFSMLFIISLEPLTVCAVYLLARWNIYWAQSNDAPLF